MGVVIRQSIKGTLCVYVGAVLGFITQFFVVTKFLAPDVIGLTKVFFEVGSLFAGFALLGTSASGMRFFPYFRDDKKGHNGFFFYYMIIPFAGSILFSSIYLLLKTPIVDFFTAKSDIFSDYFFYVVPLIFILAFWQLFENYSNINLRIAFPKGVREVCLRVFLLVGYLLFAFGFIDLTGLVLSMLISYGLCLLLDFVYVERTSITSLKHDFSFIDADLRNKYLKYSGFLMAAVLGGNIMNQLDIFMLSSVKGMYSAGIYTIAFYISSVVDMPSRSITAISTPLAAEALKNGDFSKANELYKDVSINQMLASSVILLLIWINIDNIFTIIPNGDKFSEGKYVVLFIGISKIISTTVNFGGVMVQFSKYYYWSLYLTFILTALTIGTNLYFIPRMGVPGAALATLIATIISSGYQQYIVQRKIHGNPFTFNTLKLLVIIIALWAVNKLIPSCAGVSPWLDIAVRTAIIGLGAFCAVVFLKVSPQFNGIVLKYLRYGKKN